MADHMGVNPNPVSPNDFPGIAIQIVKTRVQDVWEKTDPTQTFEVFVVWFAFTLGNWKALVSTTIPDGRYYEVTHGERGTFIDTYVKVDNREVGYQYKTMHPGHQAIQHRDAKEPWCEECGLTSDGREPASLVGRMAHRTQVDRETAVEAEANAGLHIKDPVLHIERDKLGRMTGRGTPEPPHRTSMGDDATN